LFSVNRNVSYTEKTLTIQANYSNFLKDKKNRPDSLNRICLIADRTLNGKRFCLNGGVLVDIGVVAGLPTAFIGEKLF
jgi:hypothetical protein